MKKILAIGTATLIVFSSSYVISNQITTAQNLKEQQNENKADTSSSSSETFSNQFLYQGASSIDNYVVNESGAVIDETNEETVPADNWISFSKAKTNLNRKISNSESKDIVVENNIYFDYNSGNDLTGFDSSRQMVEELNGINIEGNGHVIYSNESIGYDDEHDTNITSDEYLFGDISDSQISNLYFINTPLIANSVENSTFTNVNFYDNNFNELNSITSDQNVLGLFFNEVSDSSFNYMHLNFLIDAKKQNIKVYTPGTEDFPSSIDKFGLFVGSSINNSFQNLYLDGIDTNKFEFKAISINNVLIQNQSTLIASSENDSFINIDANGLYGNFIYDINNGLNSNGWETNVYEDFVYNSSFLKIPEISPSPPKNVTQTFIDNGNPSSINVSDYSDLYQDDNGEFHIKQLSNSYDFAHLIFQDNEQEIILEKLLTTNDDSKYNFETQVNVSKQNEDLVQLETIIPTNDSSKLGGNGGDEDTNVSIFTPFSYNTIHVNNNLEDLTSTFNNLSSFFVLNDGVISWNFSIVNNYEGKTNEALSIQNYSFSLVDSISSTSLGSIKDNTFSGTTDLEIINPILTVTNTENTNKTFSLDFGFISNESVLTKFNDDLNSNSFIVRNSVSVSYSNLSTKEGVTTYNYKFQTDLDLNYLSNYISQFVITVSYQDESIANEQFTLARDEKNNEFVSTDKIKISGNTIEFLNVAEVKTISYRIDYNNGNSVVLDSLNVRPILKGEGEGQGLVAINDNYQRENEDVTIEQVGNVFQIRNLSYVDKNTQEQVENISVYLSFVNPDGQDQLVKLSQSENDPTTFETNELSDKNNGDYTLKNIIVVNEDLNNTSSERALPFIPTSIIDSANFWNKKATLAIDSTSTFGTFQYVLVSVIAALFILILLLIIYLSIRKRRTSVATSPNVDSNLDDFEDDE